MNRRGFFKALLVSTSAVGTANLLDTALDLAQPAKPAQPITQPNGPEIVKAVKRQTRTARQLWAVSNRLEYARDSRIYLAAARGHGQLTAIEDRPALLFASPAETTRYLGAHPGLYLYHGLVIARPFPYDERQRY